MVHRRDLGTLATVTTQSNSWSKLVTSKGDVGSLLAYLLLPSLHFYLIEPPFLPHRLLLSLSQSSEVVGHSSAWPGMRATGRRIQFVFGDRPICDPPLSTKNLFSSPACFYPTLGFIPTLQHWLTLLHMDPHSGNGHPLIVIPLTHIVFPLDLPLTLASSSKRIFSLGYVLWYSAGNWPSLLPLKPQWAIWSACGHSVCEALVAAALAAQGLRQSIVSQVVTMLLPSLPPL